MSTLIRVAYIMALLPLPAAAQQALPTPSKIAAVERGLTPAVVLSGTAGTTVHGFPGYASGVVVPSVDDVLAGRVHAASPVNSSSGSKPPIPAQQSCTAISSPTSFPTWT